MLVATNSPALLGPLAHYSTPRSAPFVCFALIPTVWGDCGVAWKNHENECNAEGFAERPAHALLTRILAPDQPAQLRQDILARCPDADEVLGDRAGRFHPEVVPDWFPSLVAFLQSFYSTGLRHWSKAEYADHWNYWRARLDWSAVSDFQARVLREVAAIPAGDTLTYGQVAKRLGKPRAGRAVGAALGANPWPILVPCHRVMGQSGKLTGFSAPGGVVSKRRMLDLETGLLPPEAPDISLRLTEPPKGR